VGSHVYGGLAVIENKKKGSKAGDDWPLNSGTGKKKKMSLFLKVQKEVEHRKEKYR